MQSTGQTSTQAVSLTPMHGSVMVWGIARVPGSGGREPGEENVVLEVNVVMEIGLERLQPVPERAPGVAGAVGKPEVVGQAA